MSKPLPDRKDLLAAVWRERPKIADVVRLKPTGDDPWVLCQDCKVLVAAARELIDAIGPDCSPEVAAAQDRLLRLLALFPQESSQ